MAVDYPLQEGYDPSSDTEATGAELLQMVRQATPKAGFGVVVIGAAQPDTASNPWMVRCLWIDNSDPNDIVVRQYNPTGGSWEAIGLADGTITNDKIGALTIKATEKLDPSDGSALQVLRLNTGASATEWVDPGDLFGAGSIPVTKLGSGSEGYYLAIVGGNPTWRQLTGAIISSTLGVGGLPVDRLAKGSALQILGMDASGSALQYGPMVGFLTLSDIQAILNPNKLGFEYISKVSENHIPIVSGGNWTSISKTTLAGSSVSDESSTLDNYVLPTGTAIYSFAHGLGVVPSVVDVRLVCKTAEFGYAIGDEIPVECFVVTPSGTSDITLVSVGINATDIDLIPYDLANATNIFVSRKDATIGDFVAITTTSWAFKIYAKI